MAAHVTASIDTQHSDMIHDAQLDFYGRRLATASSDRSIKIFDVAGEEHTLSGEVQGHEGPVWQVAWSHPQFGVLLASCGYDRRVIVHREVAPGSWMKIYAFENHLSSVNSIAWAPYEYGLQLSAASSDGRISILTHKDDDSWDAVTLKDSEVGCNGISWAPAAHVGGLAQLPTGGAAFVKRIAVAGSDGQVRLHRCTFNPETGADTWDDPRTSPVIVLPGTPHKEWVRDVAWSPASGLGSNLIASCSDDGIVAIWQQTVAGDDPTWAPTLLPAFQAPVWRVSWSSTGHLLAVTCGDNSVTLWKQALNGQWQQVSAVPDPTLNTVPVGRY